MAHFCLSAAAAARQQLCGRTCVDLLGDDGGSTAEQSLPLPCPGGKSIRKLAMSCKCSHQRIPGGLSGRGRFATLVHCCVFFSLEMTLAIAQSGSCFRAHLAPEDVLLGGAVPNQASR